MEGNEIKLILRMKSAGSSAPYIWRDFETIFGELETVAYHLDRDLVYRFCKQYDVPDLYRDASLERLRHFRDRRIIVNDVRRGSWEFLLAIAAGAGYVLWSTIGKDAVDGYRASKFSKNFKEFCSDATDVAGLKLLDKIRASKVFEKATIERIRNEITVEIDAPRIDGRLPSTNQELIKMIEKDEA
jgi:hypothetical protein